MFNKKSKLQYSLIFSYLVIVLIPLIALGSIAFYISSSIVLEQTIKQDNESINHISNSVDTMINHMKSTSLIAYSSTQLQDYIKNEVVDNQSIKGDLNIHNYLYSLKSTGFKNYTFIIKSYQSNIIYCNNYDYIVDQNYVFDDLDWIKQVKEQNGNIVFVPTYSPQYFQRNDDPVFSIARQINNNYTLLPLGFIIINCNVRLIDEIIGNDRDLIYIYDKTGNQIYPYNNFHNTYSLNANNDLIQKINGEKYLISKLVSKETNLQYVKITPYNQITKTSNLIIKITIITIIISILLSLLTSFPLSRRISIPINTLIENMNNINQGKFNKSIIKTNIFEIYELNNRFNMMIQRINDHINDNYLTQIHKKNTEFKLLQSQISPHFLFNTLESIRMMSALNGDNETAQMIFKLASLYRYSIRVTSALVSLENELNHIRNYIELQKMRFGDRFNYIESVDSLSLNCEIPQLVMQPLIENCIYHGFPTANIKGTIKLTTNIENKLLTIIISDNGKGMTKDKLLEVKNSLENTKNEGHIGILATYERIKFHFEDSIFMIDSKQEKGTVITIKILYEKS